MYSFKHNIEKLQETINDFYNSTGVNINLLDVNFNPICNRAFWAKDYCREIQSSTEGKKRCRCSDDAILQKCNKSKKTEIHICHAGLVDVACPVIYDDNVIAYLILGQMKNDEDFFVVKKYVSDLNLDEKTLKKSYDKMPTYNKEKLTSIANIATMLTKYIMFESLLRPGVNTPIERAIEFINQNYEKQLSVEDVSLGSNISKTSLYKYFRIYFNCTLSEFINKKRIEEATRLLETTDLSVELISQKTGFVSASYFGRIFKELKGTTPLKCRKNAF